MRLLRFESQVPNFGDDLNDMIWSALVPDLFVGDNAKANDDAAFVGIGTIVGIDPGVSKLLEVFSSGAGYTATDRWAGLDVRYHCVRGPVTARVLDLSPNIALTDGAILTPLVDRFKFAGGGLMRRVVVVPHYETIAFPGWEQATRLAGFDLVDPRDTPESVIAVLASAELVLTESLHGAIIADTYGVPWRGFAVSRNFSTAKWADWTASVDLHVDITMVPPPDPMPLLRFGKRSEPFGTGFVLDTDDAVREFRNRIEPEVSSALLKSQSKRLLEHFPRARRFLGFSPERTAHALVNLAARDPILSLVRKRDAMRDEMLVRLEIFAKRYGTSLAAIG